MNAVAFDTLSASKKLREAGVDERTAEAIVEVVRQTTEMPSIDHLATKDDLAALERVMKMELVALRAEFSEKLRLQGWAVMGAMAALITAAVAIIKLA